LARVDVSVDRLCSGSYQRRRPDHAAVRSESTLLSQRSSWFQLAKMRLTITPSIPINDLRATDRLLARRNRTGASTRSAPPALPGIGYSGDMGPNVSIEIDQHTADVLEVRAAELGVTVPQLIAELAALDGTPRDAEAGEIAELDRRAASATPDSRVPQERVVQWLRTWGTSSFRPWPGQ
jgi:hypothetical protein